MSYITSGSTGYVYAPYQTMQKSMIDLSSIRTKSRQFGASTLASGSFSYSSIAVYPPTEIQAKIGTFKKKNGEERTMVFVELKDLPPGFLDSRLRSGEKTEAAAGEKKEARKLPVLPQGMRRVWDVDAEDFRIFNFDTIVGEIRPFTIPILNDKEKEESAS